MTDATRNLLEQHFDTAFAAPDGVAKLRELILTLAMQGKLVEQDPSDPPASEMLKEIEAEKLRLLKAGKIKNPKPLPPMKPEEAPYELPQGWEWARLGEITEYNGRKNITGEEIAPDTWLLDLEDIEKGTSRILNRAKFSERQSKSTKSTFQQGDVLYGKLRPYLDKVVVADADGVCTTEIVPIVPFKGLHSEFLRWLLKRPAFLAHVNSLMYGIKMPRLGTDDAVTSIHPLPPLPEQHRIVARIDQLMTRCDALEKLRKEREEKRLAVHAAAIKQLLDAPDGTAWDFIQQHFGELYTVKENVAELRKAILQLAVMGRLVPQNPNDPPASELLKEIEAEIQRLVMAGKIKQPKPLPPIKPEEVPYELPQGWEWVRLGELTQLITKGSSPNWQGVKYVNKGEGILFVTSENVGAFQLLLEKKKYVEDKFNQIEPRSILQKRDILMNIVGASIGRTAIFDIDEIANINQAVTIIRLIEKLDYQYFLKFFNSPTCLNYMFDRQVDNARPNLSMGNIALFAIPLPPLLEQHRIVARIDQLMTLCDNLDQQIDAASGKQTALLNALMAQV